MKLSTTYLELLTATLFTFTTAQVLSNTTYPTPKRLDIELLYPLNTTYRPSYTFPVIFAFRNPSAFWPFDFQFDWDIQLWYPEENRTRSDSGMFGRPEGFTIVGNDTYNPYFKDSLHKQSSKPYPVDELGDPYFLFDLTHIFNNISGTTQGFISWNLWFPNNCSNESPIGWERGEVTGIGEGILVQEALHFTVSNTSETFTPLPALNSTGGCSQTIASFDIEGEVEMDNRYDHRYQGTLPVLQQVPSEGECGIRVDEGLSTRIVDYMVNRTFKNEPCKVVWPNPTATSEEEMHQLCRSGAGAREYSGVLLFGFVMAWVVVWS